MEGNFEQYNNNNNNNSHTHNMFMRMSCFLIWHFNSILYYNFIKIHRYSFYWNPLYRLLLECKFPNPISFLYLWIPEKKTCLSLTWYHDYPVCIHNFYFPLNLLVLKQDKDASETEKGLIFWKVKLCFTPIMNLYPALSILDSTTLVYLPLFFFFVLEKH